MATLETFVEAPESTAAARWRTVILDFCRQRPLGAIGAAVVLLNLVGAVLANVIAP